MWFHGHSQDFETEELEAIWIFIFQLVIAHELINYANKHLLIPHNMNNNAKQM